MVVDKFYKKIYDAIGVQGFGAMNIILIVAFTSVALRSEKKVHLVVAVIYILWLIFIFIGSFYASGKYLAKLKDFDSMELRLAYIWELKKSITVLGGPVFYWEMISFWLNHEEIAEMYFLTMEENIQNKKKLMKLKKEKNYENLKNYEKYYVLNYIFFQNAYIDYYKENCKQDINYYSKIQIFPKMKNISYKKILTLELEEYMY